jgi:hypothetical protein
MVKMPWKESLQNGERWFGIAQLMTATKTKLGHGQFLSWELGIGRHTDFHHVSIHSHNFCVWIKSIITCFLLKCYCSKTFCLFLLLAPSIDW